MSNFIDRTSNLNFLIRISSKKRQIRKMLQLRSAAEYDEPHLWRLQEFLYEDSHWSESENMCDFLLYMDNTSVISARNDLSLLDSISDLGYTPKACPYFMRSSYLLRSWSVERDRFKVSTGIDYLDEYENHGYIIQIKWSRVLAITTKYGFSGMFEPRYYHKLFHLVPLKRKIRKCSKS